VGGFSINMKSDEANLTDVFNAVDNLIAAYNSNAPTTVILNKVAILVHQRQSFSRFLAQELAAFDEKWSKR
jgi:hypothetical protein